VTTEVGYIQGVSTDVPYWYILEAVDLNGSVTRHGPAAVATLAPNAVRLAAASARNQPGTAVAIGGAVALVAGWGIAVQASRRRRR
jgi:hypothetical protein